MALKEGIQEFRNIVHIAAEPFLLSRMTPSVFVKNTEAMVMITEQQKTELKIGIIRELVDSSAILMTEHSVQWPVSADYHLLIDVGKHPDTWPVKYNQKLFDWKTAPELPTEIKERVNETVFKYNAALRLLLYRLIEQSEDTCRSEA